jgi:hypothetical protein
MTTKDLLSILSVTVPNVAVEIAGSITYDCLTVEVFTIKKGKLNRYRAAVEKEENLNQTIVNVVVYLLPEKKAEIFKAILDSKMLL